MAKHDETVVDMFAGIGYFSLPLAVHSKPTKIIACELNPNAYDASHIVDVWSNDDTIEITWYEFSDAHSGVDGFSILWDQNSGTIPDMVMETSMPSDESPPLGDGDWYFHVRTVDNVGNWNSDAYHIGPFKIDTTPPTTTLLSPINDDWINDNTPTFTWTANDGLGSGVVLYWIQLSDQSDFSNLIENELVTSSSYTLSDALSDGTYHWRVIAKDAAGNWEYWDPISTWIINIDTIPPEAPRSLTASFTSSPHKSNTSNVYLFWDLSMDDGGGYNDVIAYCIYVVVNIDASPQDCNYIVPSGSGFYAVVGAGVGDENDYFYMVSAIDRAGNWGIIEEVKAGKYSIPLWAGDNYISIPLIQKDTSKDEVLMSIEGEYNRLWWYNAADGRHYKWYEEHQSYYLLTDINHKMGFYISVTDDQTLVVVGSVPISSAIKMHEDASWGNWVGYPAFSPITVEEAFHNFEINVLASFDNQDKVYISLGPEDELLQGNCYFVYINQIVNNHQNLDFAVEPVVFYSGFALTDLDKSYINDGDYYSIGTEIGELMEPPTFLDVIFEIPLTPKGELWTFYIDAFYQCQDCLEWFIIYYENPSDGSWVNILSITSDWTDDPSDTIPSHKFDFPKGLFNDYSSAYIRIQYYCPWDPFYDCIDVLHIDQMFIHTMSPGVWHIESQNSDIEFNSLDIMFDDVFSEPYGEISLSATIFNNGNLDFSQITIKFYDIQSESTSIPHGQTGMIIGEANIPVLHLIHQETFSIDALSSYTSSTTWYPQVIPGKIYVVVDFNTDEQDGIIADGYRQLIQS
jgi:hypothetical protein